MYLIDFLHSVQSDRPPYDWKSQSAPWLQLKRFTLSPFNTYFSKLLNIFVQIYKYICSIWQIYLTKLQNVFNWFFALCTIRSATFWPKSLKCTVAPRLIRFTLSPYKSYLSKLSNIFAQIDKLTNMYLLDFLPPFDRKA